ncbi:MAG: mannose-phosphate guanylyltransferase/mannose-6-phosphate isomerase [Rickettsiaceae bacterium]|jgi:mannose-1-phosphate guanylyltransferase/mannose-6-phosphate isomerase|nr:mannose-phosphate guanylyltransferase/mannose-6-phosphate isomerase [Rickettsiaceae bacterium]
MMRIKPVILAGGKGTRLWPFSKEKYPKQFLRIFSGKSLFQLTLERHQGKFFDDPLVIISKELRFIAAEQIREINIKAEIIIEPNAKNTAPCVMAAALYNINYKGALLVAPSDHLITEINSYKQAISKVSSDIIDGNILIIGIEPIAPHTGYGYIEIGDAVGDNTFKVKSFKEKPDLHLAQTYFESNNYLWHSGIILSTPQFLINEASCYENKMFESIKSSLEKVEKGEDFIWLNRDSYINISSNSIDYSILEKSSKLKLIKAKFDWQDIGNWDSLWQVSEKDENNNAVHGNTLLESVKNSYISTNNKLTAVLGVDDLIIVNTDEITLVAHKSKSEEIKAIVQRLKKPI